mgnify:CR=1 FL=1
MSLNSRFLMILKSLILLPFFVNKQSSLVSLSFMNSLSLFNLEIIEVAYPFVAAVNT